MAAFLLLMKQHRWWHLHTKRSCSHILLHTRSGNAIAPTAALKQRALPHSEASANVCTATKRFHPLLALRECTFLSIGTIIWPYWWCWFKTAALINVATNKTHVCLRSIFITQCYSYNFPESADSASPHKGLAKEIWNYALKMLQSTFSTFII